MSAPRPHPIPSRVPCHVAPLTVIALCAVVGALSACVAPVLPIPPPSLDRMQLELDAAAGTAVLKGTYEPGYLLFAYNNQNGKGVVVRADEVDGSYTSDPFAVSDGDRIDIWGARYAEGTRSTYLCVEIDASSSRGYTECSGP